MISALTTPLRLHAHGQPRVPPGIRKRKRCKRPPHLQGDMDTSHRRRVFGSKPNCLAAASFDSFSVKPTALSLNITSYALRALHVGVGGAHKPHPGFNTVLFTLWFSQPPGSKRGRALFEGGFYLRKYSNWFVHVVVILYHTALSLFYTLHMRH